MKQLYDKDQVFGVIGNVGTPTAAVAVPFALERRMLFFGAFTGSSILRSDPPDRYVFNYRASYVQETDAVVRYLVKMRRLQPQPDRGLCAAGLVRRFRLAGRGEGVPRHGRQRQRDPPPQLCSDNTVDVDDADQSVEAAEDADQGDGHGRDLPGRGEFIEKTESLIPGLIYTSVFVRRLHRACRRTEAARAALRQRRDRDPGGARRYLGYSSHRARAKNALAKYFPGEAPDYVSLEGYVAANVLISGHQAGRPAVRHREADRRRWRPCTIGDLGLGSRSASAAPSTRPPQGGARRSTKADVIGARLELIPGRDPCDRGLAVSTQRFSMTRLCTARPEIAARVGEPRHGKPGAVGADPGLAASTKIQSPCGSRVKN